MISRCNVYPGTFGYLDIIHRALHAVDRLVISVVLDTGKHPLFALERSERSRQHRSARRADRSSRTAGGDRRG